MYKVFVNKTPIVLTDNVSEIDREKWRVMLFKGGKQLVDLVHSIESGLVKKPTVVYHYDIDELWFSFLKKSRFIWVKNALLPSKLFFKERKSF